MSHENDNPSSSEKWENYSYEDKLEVVNLTIMNIMSIIGFILVAVLGTYIIYSIKRAAKLGPIKQNDRFMLAVIALLGVVFATLVADLSHGIYEQLGNEVDLTKTKILNYIPSFFFVLACVINARNWA